MEQKDTYLEKLVLQLKDEVKERSRENNWMGQFSGSNNNEMMKIQFEAVEENMKALEKKIENF